MFNEDETKKTTQQKGQKYPTTLAVTRNSVQSAQDLSGLSKEDLNAMLSLGKQVNNATNDSNTQRHIALNNTQKTLDNSRDLSIWLNGFAEAFSQFAAIYPIASFTDWVAQLIDSDDSRWKPQGFTQDAQFSPNAFYIALGLTFFLMVGSGYCHSEMQRLTQLKRKLNQHSQGSITTKQVSLSADKIFYLMNDALAHWLAKIGVPIIMTSLNVHNPLLRYISFIVIALLGAIATVPEFVSCYNTLLEIQALEKPKSSHLQKNRNDTTMSHFVAENQTLTEALLPVKSESLLKHIAENVNQFSAQLWSKHAQELIQFSFATQCLVSYLDNQLVFQQIIGNPFWAIPFASLATPAEAIGQYALNFNKKTSGDTHFCASSNCTIGAKKATSWTDYNERSACEKGLLWWRNASLSAGCIEAALLLLILLGKITPTQKQIASSCFFIAGLILTRADRRNIATEIKNYNDYNYRNGGRSLLDFNYCKKNTDAMDDNPVKRSISSISSISAESSNSQNDFSNVI